MNIYCEIYSLILCLDLREDQGSLGLNDSEHCCEQTSLSKTHFDTPGQMLALRPHIPSTWGMETDPYTSNQEPHALSFSEGKYICHSYCRDLVHLDYPQNGKLPNCGPTCEVRHSSKKNIQVGTLWYL